MLQRYATFLVSAMLCAIAIHARAENQNFKWPDALQPLPQTSVFANGPRTTYAPFILPDLYLSRPPSNAGSVATIARFSGPELSSLSGATSNLVAAPPIVTRFDLGLTNTASTAPSILGQPTIPGQSLSSNMLAAPPMLRDAGTGLGSANQFVLPAQYLNDSHQFRNP